MQEISYKFNYGKVRVKNIINTKEADHLRKFIGATGEVVSRIALDQENRKYKVMIGQETYYFLEEELEEVK